MRAHSRRSSAFRSREMWIGMLHLPFCTGKKKNSLMLILTSNVTRDVNIHIIRFPVKRAGATPPVRRREATLGSAETVVVGAGMMGRQLGVSSLRRCAEARNGV